ncbi:putative U3 small nucleolar ribonucleoprotein protein Lcp5 [Taphrina deformans PYCC 5710]|uniref:U3 small nucleolar ribonucleoprotein protein Lcp5 n=1 Tax=Taphrina deformans (strain PYCC 5710 / ATCC 11124 / CBS 356.35 / IMI 108563 / JCM 9778 / NBRC 8474) TaxID=1097556 RepID=R4X8Z9_TAPDE|nr:putative U3 small nucleolar ribonucleoprotein protein Lcp5 [Taphrina deformans PYCC 5710]|eukprot:CCG82118.1 putative U3 small nucleolar ribonucleoprotein protein Lcp5 [Taphrina deformans PYCC 5710]
MENPEARLGDIKASFVGAKNSLPKSDILSGTKDGISLLSLKSHLLLSYLQHVAFYIILKLRGEKIDEGEFKKVVDQLIDLRVYLDKGVKPIETKLRYQIDKVIRAAERVTREGQLKDLDENARDALAYKPKPQALVVDKAEEAMDNDGIYRPPRIASTLPARELMARRRAPNNTLREFVDSELSAAPVAEPSIGSNIITQGRQGNSTIQSSRDRAHQSERDRYEEENYIRLPTTGKQKTGRRNDDIYGGEDFRVLDQELYDFGKGPRESLVDRSRKRAQEEREDGGDGPVPNGATGKFKKRKKVLAGRAKNRR